MKGLKEINSFDRAHSSNHAKGFYLAAKSAYKACTEIYTYSSDETKWNNLSIAEQSFVLGHYSASLTCCSFAVETLFKALLKFRSLDRKSGNEYGDRTHDLFKLFEKIKSENPLITAKIEKNFAIHDCKYKGDFLNDLQLVSNYFECSRYSNTTNNYGQWVKIKHFYDATNSVLEEEINI